MKLSQLLESVPHKTYYQHPLQRDAQITRVVCDSRQVQPGCLFVAIPGVAVDGHHFVREAIGRGAVAVVGEQPPASALNGAPPVHYAQVADSREALALLCAAWYDHPGKKMRVVGVTGTDGKTTTVRLIASVLESGGYATGLISTVSAQIGEKEENLAFHTTTPDASEVQRYLAQMVDRACRYAIVEATSHGLAQQRVAGCEFDVAVVTNITHEHLDYHGSFEEYRNAKARLFASLRTAYHKPDVAKVSILNADDPSYDFLEEFPAQRYYSYAVQRPADIQAIDVQCDGSGISFTAVTPDGAFPVKSPLIGAFNVYNILAAIAVGISQGVPFKVIQDGVASMRGVTGRMEAIDLGQEFSVIIDFAHTPNSLTKALETVRTLVPGRVIVVFGCAGLRDMEKRPVMGEIAGRLAHQVILTAEDPRTEDVNEIMKQIGVGCERAGKTLGKDYVTIADRAEAIATAMRMACPGDLVLVTGKGHERSMCFGTVEHPWSDHEAVRRSLRDLLN